MKKVFTLIPYFVFLLLSLVFIYPIFQGLILLPLDLLVSNYSPWNLANTILLKNAYMQDSIMQLYPWRHLVYESIRSGVVPFWNPYQFMGMPFMAAMKPMVFYPLNLLFGFGEVSSWHLLLLFQLVGAGCFMYLFVKEITKHTIAAMVSGICFAYSSLMIGLLEFGSDGNAIIWLPLLLFASKKYLDTHKKKWITLFGLSIVIAVFAGHLQYLGYELFVTGIFILAYGRKTKARISMYGWLATAGIVGLGVSAIQLFPSLEMFRYSYRGIANSYDVFSSGLLKPYQLIRLLSPDFFGSPITRDLQIGYIEQSGYFGIIPLFFVLWAMITYRGNWFVRLFSAICIFGILFSLDGIAQLLYVLKIPLITSGYGGRMFYTVLFSGSVLSGLGMYDYIQSGNEVKKRRWLLWYVIAVFVIYCVSFALTKIIHTTAPSLTNLKFPIIIMAMFGTVGFCYHWLKHRSVIYVTILFCVAILGITYFDLFRLGYRFLTFSNRKFLYPESKVAMFVKEQTKDTLGRVYGLAEPELPSYLGVYTVETYNSLYSMRTGILLQALDGKDSKDLPVNKYLLNKNENLKYILDLTGTSLIVIDKGRNPASEYFRSSRFEKELTKVFENDKFDVYRNDTSIPRFGVYYDVKQNVSDAETLQMLQSRSINLQSTVIVDESLPIPLQSGTGSAKLLSSTVNDQVFQVTSDKPGLFYVSDAYFPGWKAMVNGDTGRIYKTNYNFRSVLVPSGTSEVRFQYQPTHWPLFVWISVISLLLLVILAFI